MSIERKNSFWYFKKDVRLEINEKSHCAKVDQTVPMEYYFLWILLCDQKLLRIIGKSTVSNIKYRTHSNDVCIITRKHNREEYTK